MVKHIAPRNLVLLRRPPATGPPEHPSPLLTAVRSALRGAFSCIHTPNVGQQVRMASIAAYVASMTKELSQLVEEQPKVQVYLFPYL